MFPKNPKKLAQMKWGKQEQITLEGPQPCGLRLKNVVV